MMLLAQLTSIDQLLNPVASQQGAQIDPRSVYPQTQLSNIPPQGVAYLPPNHQQHVSAPASYPPPMQQQPGSFRLSAASWDQNAEERVSPRHHELDSSANLRRIRRSEDISTDRGCDQAFNQRYQQAAFHITTYHSESPFLHAAMSTIQREGI